MESSVKTKNIFYLLTFFLFGFGSGVLLVSFQSEYWDDFLKSLNGCSSLEVVSEMAEEAESDIEIIETVEEEDLCEVRVDVSGAVKKPGVYCLEEGTSVVDSIQKAGGYALGYGEKYVSMKINLAKVLSDNSKIYIPYMQDSNCEIIDFKIPKEIETIISDEVPNTPPEENLCTSINNAKLEKLDELAGIGPSTAQKIIDGRPYQSIDDLLNVSGIGDSTLSKIRDKICL